MLRQKFLTLLFAASLSVAVSCSADEPSAARIDADNNLDGDTRTLIAYFSAQGTTKGVAEAIQRETGADIFFIEPAVPYADNPYDDSDRIQNEAYNDLRPEVKTYLTEEQMAKYDTIFVGTPCWWHQPAMVVCTFLEHYNKIKDVPHGTVSKVWYDSPSLGMARRLTVYTPAGYGKGEKRYPVFYLLHGKGGDENAWPELGRATQILDNMIASGEAEPMIVVMTNGNAAQQATPGESSLGFRQPTDNLPKTMDGSFERSFPEIVEFIDNNYRTKADKKDRAIAGLSMGGFHSMQISKEYPDMFDFVGLFSAALWLDRKTDSPVYADVESKLKTQFSNKPALYWIAIGDDDFLYDTNVKFRKHLDDNGYPYVYKESAGGHSWRNWRTYLTEFLPLLFR